MGGHEQYKTMQRCISHFTKEDQPLYTISSNTLMSSSASSFPVSSILGQVGLFETLLLFPVFTLSCPWPLLYGPAVGQRGGGGDCCRIISLLFPGQCCLIPWSKVCLDLFP